VELVVVELRDVAQPRCNVRHLVLEPVEFRHVAGDQPHVDGLEIEDIDGIAHRSLAEDRNDAKIAIIKHPHDVGAKDGARTSGGRGDDGHRVCVHHVAIRHLPGFVLARRAGRRPRVHCRRNQNETHHKNCKKPQMRGHD
jgi:hypothetical protein